MVAFAVLIFLILGPVKTFSTSSQPSAYDKTLMCTPASAITTFSTISLLLGAITTTVSDFLGKKIATYANTRTTRDAEKRIGEVCIIAFRIGAGMGFLLAKNGPLVLYIASNFFKQYHGEDWGGMFESIPGYGIAGSSMALFGRVGGGIHLKAADVDATLISRVKGNNPKDHPRNLAVIANNVGANVGDIVSTMSDLFGPTAVFIVGVISLKSPELDWDALFLDEPVLLIGFVFLGSSLEERATIKMSSDMHELSSLVATQSQLVITPSESVNSTNLVLSSDVVCTEIPTDDLCVEDFVGCA